MQSVSRNTRSKDVLAPGDVPKSVYFCQGALKRHWAVVRTRAEV